jgi:hypothetical protein
MLLRLGRMPLIREALGPDAEQALVQEAAARLRDVAGQDVVGPSRRQLRAGGCCAPTPTNWPCARAACWRRWARRTRWEHDELHLDPSIGIAVYPNDGVAYECWCRARRRPAPGGRRRGPALRLLPPGTEPGRERPLQAGERAAPRTRTPRARAALPAAVDIAGGTIVGAEALLRWRHPERGLVPPANSSRWPRKPD